MFTKSKLALFTLAGLATADQPVHCLKNDVLGDWVFTASRDQFLPDIFSSHSVCTHELPNKVQVIEAGHNFSIAGETYEIEVTLMDQNRCQGRIAGRSFTTQECEWTMMYDQAMIIKLPGYDLMANFRYEVMDGL